MIFTEPKDYGFLQTENVLQISIGEDFPCILDGIELSERGYPSFFQYVIPTMKGRDRDVRKCYFGINQTTIKNIMRILMDLGGDPDELREFDDHRQFGFICVNDAKYGKLKVINITADCFHTEKGHLPVYHAYIPTLILESTHIPEALIEHMD